MSPKPRSEHELHVVAAQVPDGPRHRDGHVDAVLRTHDAEVTAEKGATAAEGGIGLDLVRTGRAGPVADDGDSLGRQACPASAPSRDTTRSSRSLHVVSVRARSSQVSPWRNTRTVARSAPRRPPGTGRAGRTRTSPRAARNSSASAQNVSGGLHAWITSKPSRR